jgi:hypothetical protein
LIGAGVVFFAACVLIVVIARTGRWTIKNIKGE